MSVLLVTASFMVTTTPLAPVAFAQDERQQRDPNEGEPKHEINELQNRLHETEDESKQNHLEGEIDALEDQRLSGLQAGFDENGCQLWEGHQTCWPQWWIRETRDARIAGATFTLGLTLLVEDCRRVLL